MLRETRPRGPQPIILLSVFLAGVLFVMTAVGIWQASFPQPVTAIVAAADTEKPTLPIVNRAIKADLVGSMNAWQKLSSRAAFGRLLIDQPLMRNVLADLAIESEAATTAMMRLAGANDRAVHGDVQEGALRRLALAATKYYVCKRGPALAAEALECLGGNGYTEDFDLARIYRELPLLSVWVLA